MVMYLKQGTQLQDGKYVIKRVLGQGGFGITYLAEQVLLKREVAIKEFFMKDNCLRDDETGAVSVPSTGSAIQVERYRAKFLKEAQTMASLDHPNIVKVIDVFEQNGTVYYVMPYLNGGSLSDLVKAQGRLPEDAAMRYIHQIAAALKYMHEEKRVCHYDIKPANILLDKKGNAVLIDFGISKNYDSDGNETSSTPIGKSAGFAPLEQYQDMVKEFSPASDVYALGATLYYLVMGKTPPTAVSLSQGEDLTFDNRVSQGTRSLIKDTMQISSRKRPQSVTAFLDSPSDDTLPADDETHPSNCDARDNKKGKAEVKALAKPSAKPKESISLEDQISKKNRSGINWLTVALVIVLLTFIGLLLIIQPWNTSSTTSSVELIDSLQVSPVYTAKHAFECLKNGDEEGFKSCLIEFDDELSQEITIVDGKMPSEVRDEYEALFFHGIEIFYIDYNTYNNYLGRTGEIIQDQGGDLVLNGDIIRLVSFMPDFIREGNGYGLSTYLRFIQNSKGQWKMSIPLTSHSGEDVAISQYVVNLTPDEAIDGAAKSFALNPPATEAVAEPAAEAVAEPAAEAAAEPATEADEPAVEEAK